MKIAIAGKGGVGKTTLAALLSMIYVEQGHSVLAIDGDPAACLADALGLPDELASKIEPISEMEQLIYERTGAKPGTIGGFFTMNPRVDDIPERFGVDYRGVKVLQLGTIDVGGSGCICPESALLKALVTHVVLYTDQRLILDMEAGLEHLGRATAGAVDSFVVVVEPGKRSLHTAQKIAQLAQDIGVKSTRVVGNKVRNDRDREFIASQSGQLPVLGYLPFSPDAITADMEGKGVFDTVPDLVAAARTIADQLG